jgi:hypothetical protein
MIRLMVSQLASLSWNKAPIWGLWPDFYFCQFRVCCCGALCLTRGQVCCLSFAAGLRQRSHSWVWVLWNSQPYFIVSDTRLPFSLLPTTRRATVEIFGPRCATQTQSYLTTGSIPPINSSCRRTPWDSQPEFFFLNWTPPIIVLI